MAAETNEELFKKINALYAQFDAIRTQENVESARLALRNKIVTAVCKLYFLRSVESKIKTTGAANISAQDNASYSAEIVEKTVMCLKKFSDSDSYKNGGLFSKYVCNSVSKMLSSLKEKESLSEKNTGSKISDGDFKNAKKVKTLDKQYKNFGFASETERNVKIADALEISTAEVERYKNMWRNGTVSLNEPMNKDDEESDELGDFIAGNKQSKPENLYFRKHDWEILFDLIQKGWEREKSDATLSKLLTVDVLSKVFSVKKKDRVDGKVGIFIESRGSTDFEKIAFDPRPLLQSCGFLDKGIFQSFFFAETYVLPQLQHIMAEQGKSKSAASKTLSRFYEKIKADFEKSGEESLFAEHFFEKSVNWLNG